MKVSKPLQEFFAAEIRNEDEGGVRPATLASALDSWRQAPEDILFELDEIAVAGGRAGRRRSGGMSVGSV